MARILVIDDDDDVRELLSMALRAKDHEVVLARSGSEGLELTRSRRPDLIILDILMPGLDGYAVMARLRQEGVCPATPVILLTALGAGQDVVLGLRSGANDYIRKPFNTEELVARAGVQLRIVELERKVAQSEAYHRALFERSADSDLLLTLDGRVLQTNIAATERFAAEAATLEGTTFADLVAPRERPKFDVAFSGAAEGSDIPIFEVHVRTREGAFHPFDADIGPVDIEGTRFLLLHLRDIRRRMSAEARSTMIFEHIRDSVFITDGKGLVMLASRSAAELVGCPQDELIGQDITDYQDSTPSPRWETFTALAAFEEEAPDRNPVVTEGTLIRKDGSRVPVEWTMAAFHVGSEVFFIGVARDLTDRRAAEERRREAERLATLLQIAGGAAHEINQPLTAILGYAEMTLAALPEDNPVRKHQEHIVRASQRISGILKQMQALRDYRTRPYADGHAIVDFRPGSNAP